MKSGFLKRFFLSKLFIVAGVVVLLVIGTATVRDFLQRQQINKEVDDLKGQISGLEKGNDELNSLISYLQTSQFIEAEAKTKLGLAREGESVVVISKPDSPTIDPASVRSVGLNVGEDVPNPKRWWLYFWGN